MKTLADKNKHPATKVHKPRLHTTAPAHPAKDLERYEIRNILSRPVLQRKAFTHQNDIWLGAGESQKNLRLMAHEVTHVIQKSEGIWRKNKKNNKEKWLHIFEGPAKNKSDDYVVAGISQGGPETWEVELVPPKARYTPPVGWDLDCFIFRDCTSLKFFGKLAYLGIKKQLNAEETRENFGDYIDKAQRLFVIVSDIC